MLPEGITKSSDAQVPAQTMQDGMVGLEVDRAVFSVDAVLRAAYKFTDRFHIFVQTHNTTSSRWLVVMRPKSGSITIDAAGEFANELIDQRLRERLEQQFGDVRTLIVAQAFAEGNLLEPDREEADYKTDPRGIGRLRP